MKGQAMETAQRLRQQRCRELAAVARRGPIITAPQRGQTNPYQKWMGPHWTLYQLAELGHPPGDRKLLPLRDQFYTYLFDARHLRPPRSLLIPGQEERFRRCAGQEGYAVWYSLKLGLEDGRTAELVDRLIRWQWPDGGWNCDKRPGARHSSLHETVIPLRALALWATVNKDRRAKEAADRAAEVLLSRRLLWRRRTGRLIDPRFALIHYPHFYHYNLLFALTVLHEGGYLHDPRCAEALDLLAGKRLPDGGFPLERRLWRPAPTITTGGTWIDWGPTGRRQANPFVTAAARAVLQAAS